MRKRRGFCDEAEMADRDGTGWLRRQFRTWEWRNQNPNDLAKISMRIPMMRQTAPEGVAVAGDVLEGSPRLGNCHWYDRTKDGAGSQGLRIDFRA